MEWVWIELNNYAMEFLNKPSLTEALLDALVCVVPIWVAVMIGLFIGWSWRPRWTGLIFLGFRSKFRFFWTAPPGFGARRFWLAVTAFSAFSVGRRLWSRFRGQSSKLDSPAESVDRHSVASSLSDADEDISHDVAGDIIRVSNRESNKVTERDLEHLLYLLSSKDGVIAWQSMMERSTSNLTYKAWSYEPQTGPIIYQSRTVFEDATPELLKDFFWDDEFRPKWDPMLAYVKIVEECHDTGMMISHWIKKFPFFCSDREYIIAKRIWEAGNASYCITKGIEYPTLQKRDKPRRVDCYFSSWVIKPVESHEGDGQHSACEVTLVHYEDMGIPRDIAKLGVRHVMWGTVKKLHTGFRAYQNARRLDSSTFSRCAVMARNTMRFPEVAQDADPTPSSNPETPRRVQDGINWKWLVLGGAVAVVCGLHTGLLGKALVIGAGQRVHRRRSNPR